jgi:hypothetical protein
MVLSYSAKRADLIKNDITIPLTGPRYVLYVLCGIAPAKLVQEILVIDHIHQLLIKGCPHETFQMPARARVP